MKVLIADRLDEKALYLFEEKNIAVDYKPEITPEALLAIIPSYDALIVRSRTKVTKEIIGKGSTLKVIGRAGSGVDNIDVKTAQEKNIIVVNTPDANAQAAAELTTCLITAYIRDLPKAFNSMKGGLWIKNDLWGSEIFGKTVGILGYGHVGKKVAKIMESLGAKVLIHSRSYQTTTLHDIFASADIVTIHLSLNNETKGCITKELLLQMKQTAILVNISRGELVDEEALYEILKNKKIKGAILDVFWQEPLPPDSKWRKLDNAMLTPHIGASTHEALERASLTVAEDIVNVLKGGKPQNPVL